MSAAVAPAAPGKVIELESVSVQFGGVHAMRDVSLWLPDVPGISAIIGPNGAGKTTLFNVVTGLVPPRAGRVRFRGRDITHRRPEQIFRAGLGRTFQGVRLFANLTLFENLLIAVRSLHARRDAQARAEAALSHVGLGRNLWDRFPSELTLVQSRFAEIARAVAAGPAALMLDEPGAGLNPAEKREVCDLLRATAGAYGCRIVLVEHDMKLVMSVAETIWVMNFGTILMHGTPEQVQADESVIEAYLGSGSDES